MPTAFESGIAPTWGFDRARWWAAGERGRRMDGWASALPMAVKRGIAPLVGQRAAGRMACGVYYVGLLLTHSQVVEP
jgi:hypothetical protein